MAIEERDPPGDLERHEARLLEEYRAHVELWKHDDTLRQQRTANFLTVNTVLLAVAGLALSAEPATPVAIAMVALFSAFGVSVALVWATIQWRNSEYIRLRRVQLRQLETRLPPMSAFTNAHRALDRHEEIDFGDDGTFRVRPGARSSSTLRENLLPPMVLVFWLVAFVVLELAVILD